MASGQTTENSHEMKMTSTKNVQIRHPSGDKKFGTVTKKSWQNLGIILASKNKKLAHLNFLGGRGGVEISRDFTRFYATSTIFKVCEFALPSSQSVSQHILPLGYEHFKRHPFLLINLKSPAITPPAIVIKLKIQKPS